MYEIIRKCHKSDDEIAEKRKKVFDTYIPVRSLCERVAGAAGIVFTPNPVASDQPRGWMMGTLVVHLLWFATS